MANPLSLLRKRKSFVRYSPPVSPCCVVLLHRFIVPVGRMRTPTQGLSLDPRMQDTNISLFLKCIGYLKDEALLNLPPITLGPIAEVTSGHLSEVSHGWSALFPVTPASHPSMASHGDSVPFLSASLPTQL